MKTAIAMLAARLLAPNGSNGNEVIEGTSIRCVTLDQRETQIRRLHFFVCLDSQTGETRGALLRRNGKVVCPVTGTYDGKCFALEFCGEAAEPVC